MHQIRQQPSSIMRENRVKSENEIGIFRHRKEQDRGDIAHFCFPLLFFLSARHFKMKKIALSSSPQNISSVIFHLGKFLNINPRHKKSKRQNNKERKGHKIK